MLWLGRMKELGQGIDDETHPGFHQRPDHTRERCEGFGATCVLRTLRDLARDDRRAQGPLCPIVRRLHPRDYAIIMTFLQTGIRLSELANLAIEDVDVDHKLLTVRQGKGKKDRQIPLVDEVVKALRNYLRYRNTQLVLDDEILFLAKNGTSLNVSSVKYIVAKYVKKAGIRKKVSVHTLRHTFGAHKADKNMGIATLQELMGHKTKETTLKYIHLAKTNLRQEMMQTAL